MQIVPHTFGKFCTIIERINDANDYLYMYECDATVSANLAEIATNGITIIERLRHSAWKLHTRAVWGLRKRNILSKILQKKKIVRWQLVIREHNTSHNEEPYLMRLRRSCATTRHECKVWKSTPADSLGMIMTTSKTKTSYVLPCVHEVGPLRVQTCGTKYKEHVMSLTTIDILRDERRIFEACNRH